MSSTSRSGEKVFKGIPVSGGVCRGQLLVLCEPEGAIPCRQITEEEVPGELHRLEDALVRTRQQIVEVQRQVEQAMGAEDASIFEAHLLVLDDRTLIDEVVRVMHQKKVNVEQSFHEVAEKYATTLGSIDDDYLRERASDMRDVTARILNNLLDRPEQSPLANVPDESIVIGRDLSPSMTASLDKQKVVGFATDVGSRTSHTAIMARSLRMPAIVGLQHASQQLETGQTALLDGYNGLLIINPTRQTLFEYGQLVRRRVSFQESLEQLRQEPATTEDGLKVILSANIEQAGDVQSVLASGAEGVGLFRTEYLFINRSTLPTEDEQFAAYHAVAAALKPKPVIIRTLDLGGDKFMSHLQVPKEMNPFLGWRAIRFCLEEREIFREQLRAAIRASVEGNVKIMYPMISCLNELEQANHLLEEYKEELRREGVPFDKNLEVGAMIETPSAALIAQSMAKRVQFLSLGTNDLIQYSLAVDRLNEKIAHLYEPTHPAIVKLVKLTVDAAHANHLWVGVCGEMAADPALVPLLIGLGVDELSVAPAVVPQIKYLIRHLKAKQAQELAVFALESESGEDILMHSQALARQAAPTLFDDQ